MKRLFAFLLALVMALGMIPTAYATETEEPHVHIEELTMEETEPTVEEPVQVSEPAMTATSGTCGENVTWKLVNGTLTISGTGAMTDYESQSDVPWCDYRGEILTLVIEHGVTGIGEDAFRGCRKMTKATIPDSVTRIGDFAFSNCGKLQSITIPDSVTSLGENCFDFCSGLTSVSIGKGLTSISFAAFGQCNSLESIVIPDNITVIEAYAFTVCNSLKSITIPKHVTMIDQYAFADCTALKEITFTGDAPWFGEEVFLGVTANAYYPGNNSTWTADVMHNYGGNLTWEVFESFCEHEACTEVPSKEPTCTESGNNRYLICDDCGTVLKADGITKTNVEAETIPALGHDYLSKVTAPTCTEGGYTTHTCDICGDTYVDSYTDIIPHSWDEGVVVKEPTEDTPGIRKHTCMACGETEDREIAPLTHTHAYTPTVHAPTCTHFGWTTYTCSCGDTYDDNYVDALGHDFGKWVVTKEATSTKEGSRYRDCARCGYRETETIGKLGTIGSGTCGKNVKWVLKKDGTLTISGKGAMKNYYWDNPTSPWDRYNSKIKKIVIQDGVTSIGDFAFMGCMAKSISIPGTVKTIGDYAFRGSALESVEVPEGVKTIGKRAFESAYSLKSVVIPKSVTNMGEYMFFECESLSSVDLLCNIKAIKECSFDCCVSLKEIKIPDSVEKIEASAFTMCTSLKTVILSKNLTTIGTNAFTNGSEGLTLVFKEPPMKLKSVNKHAFDSWSLPKIVLCGSPEQWDTIKSKFPDKINNVKFHAFVKEICIYCGVKDGPCVYGHIGEEVLRNQKDYTCTEDGYSGDTYCTVCQETLKKGEVIPAAHTFTDEVIEPTYTKQGYTIRTCFCGHVENDFYVEAKGLLAPVLSAKNDMESGKTIISWEVIPEADGYEIYRATSKTGKYTKVGTVETATYTDTKATAGKTYYYKVKAICAADAKLNSKQSAAVSAKCLFAQPVAETSNNSSGYPVVKWKKVTGAKKYDVYYSTTKEGTYKKLTTTSSTSYTYSKAKTDTEYYFKVRAYGTSSTYASAFSEIVTGIRKLAKPAITVTVNNEAGTAKITWKKITGANSYELQCSVNGGEFEPIEATLTAKSTSYTHTGLTVGNTYTYRLRALSSNEEANSDYCAEKKAAIKCGAPKLTVTNDENGKPVLTWNTVEGAATYEIQMATSSKGKYKKLTVVTDTTYTHTTAAGAKTYYYKVRAIDANGVAGAYSTVKSKLCKCAAPEITTVTTNSSGYPTVKWGKVSGAKKYEVWYATAKDGSYKKLTTTSSTSYTYTKAKMDTEYYFKIRAYGASTTSMSAYSEIVCAVRKLAQPSLTVTANQRDRFITLKWKAVSKAEFYELQCSINGGEYETIATGKILSYTDKYLEPGNKYTYRARAISANEATSSDYCAAKSATIKVGKPTLSIKLEKGKPSLTWTEVEGAVKYQVYYATSKSGKYKLVKTTEDLNYIYTAAKKGKTCYFKVRAVDQNGTAGDYSTVKSIKSK